ncbi:hypothetical protein ACMV8I_11985 [Ewingella sp. S1.OA.A_B6]
MKFSPQNVNENTQRWADLLRCEAYALETLIQTNIPAASAEIYTGWAVYFWRKVQEDTLISPEFRQFASQMRDQVEGLIPDIQRLA